MDQTQGLRTIIGVVASQIYFTGWQALPLITTLALTTGGILILQGMGNLNLLGWSEMIGNFMVVVLVREAGPLLTALVVIARSGNRPSPAKLEICVPIVKLKPWKVWELIPSVSLSFRVSSVELFR